MKKYLIYRFNCFLKDEGATSLIRVAHKEYRIKKDIFTYEELLECISYFREPKDVSTMTEYSLDSYIVTFLLKIEVLSYSEIDYPDSKVFGYLVKNYSDFNNIEKLLAESEFEINCFGDDSKKMKQLLTDRINTYFADIDSSDKKIRFVIIVVNQDTYYEEIVKTAGRVKPQNYIVIAFNKKRECRVFVTDEVGMIHRMLDHFMNCSGEKITYSDNYYSIAGNYAVLMVMDSLSENRRLHNTYSINDSLEIQNKNYYGFIFGKEAFTIRKSEDIVVDKRMTTAESVNRFIFVSKDLLDIDFEYEFISNGNINKVVTKMRYIEATEAVAESEILLNAAKESIRRCLRSFFENQGVIVQVAFGIDEVNDIKAKNSKIALFSDAGVFSEAGVLIFRVDKDYAD
ncbi:MAG: hypothetical protein ACI4EF_12555 [Coprococcus sp.]